MISYVILDDRYNMIIDSKCTIETIEKVINDDKMKKMYEFTNDVNNKQVYWYQNINSKYLLIYEI